jgi:hypothetical protein
MAVHGGNNLMCWMVEQVQAYNAWLDARSWTISENYWYNPTSKEINVTEVWYRRWVHVPVLKFSDGRIVEYDMQ